MNSVWMQIKEYHKAVEDFSFSCPRDVCLSCHHHPSLFPAMTVP
jgi:hypothetical protein